MVLQIRLFDESDDRYFAPCSLLCSLSLYHSFFFISSLTHTNELENNLRRKCAVNLFLGYSI